MLVRVELWADFFFDIWFGVALRKFKGNMGKMADEDVVGGTFKYPEQIFFLSATKAIFERPDIISIN